MAGDMCTTYTDTRHEMTASITELQPRPPEPSRKRWAARDSQHHYRRIIFGTREQAEGFLENCPGWEVLSEDDPEWLPLPGEEGWQGWPDYSDGE